MTRYGRCALVALLALCNVSSTDANIYNRLRQSGGNAFNPLMRVGIRGGETSTKSNPAIPKVPTSKAELGASSASVAGPPRKKKRKKRSSSSSIAQQPAIPPAPVPAPAPVVKQTPVVVEKVVEEPKVEPQPEPEPIAVSTPPVEPEPEPVISVPAPLKPKPKSKITEKAQNNKKLAETLKEKMPTLFVRDEEKQYDTYAACLAATESLRRIRDSKRKNMKEFSAVDVEGKSWKSILNPSSDSSGGGDKNGEPTAEEEYKRACAEYVLNSSKAINALGLSVTQFNQLGREISKDKSLKEKVRIMRKSFGMTVSIHEKVHPSKFTNLKRTIEFMTGYGTSLPIPHGIHHKNEQDTTHTRSGLEAAPQIHPSPSCPNVRPLHHRNRRIARGTKPATPQSPQHRQNTC